MAVEATAMVIEARRRNIIEANNLPSLHPHNRQKHITVVKACCRNIVEANGLPPQYRHGRRSTSSQHL
jgi:hypothetical protein